MSSCFDTLLRPLLLSLALAIPAVHAAQPLPAPQPWTQATWAEQLKSGPRPAAYVFTTSYCSTCPDAFAQVAEASAGRRPGVPLIAVMMDAQGHQAMHHAVHFKGLTALYTFDGHEAAIRHSIDPQWPNITPYIVLVDRQGRRQTTIGSPEPKMLQNWLR